MVGGVMSGLNFSQKKNFSEHCLSSQKPPILSAAMATQDPSPLPGDKHTLAFPGCTSLLVCLTLLRYQHLDRTWLVFISVSVSQREAVVPDVVHTSGQASMSTQADPPEASLS